MRVAGRTAAVLVIVVVLALAGCGSGQQGDAEKFTAKELTLYGVVDGGAHCSKTSSTDSDARYACHADVVSGGTSQPITIVVQCVNETGRCSRVPT
jgi:hypothetical protein